MGYIYICFCVPWKDLGFGGCSGVNRERIGCWWWWWWWWCIFAVVELVVESDVFFFFFPFSFFHLVSLIVLARISWCWGWAGKQAEPFEGQKTSSLNEQQNSSFVFLCPALLDPRDTTINGTATSLIAEAAPCSVLGDTGMRWDGMDGWGWGWGFCRRRRGLWRRAAVAVYISRKRRQATLEELLLRSSSVYIHTPSGRRESESEWGIAGFKSEARIVASAVTSLILILPVRYLQRVTWLTMTQDDFSHLPCRSRQPLRPSLTTGISAPGIHWVSSSFCCQLGGSASIAIAIFITVIILVTNVVRSGNARYLR